MTLIELKAERPHWSYSSLFGLLSVCSLQWGFERFWKVKPEGPGPLPLTILAINHHRQDYRRPDIARALEFAAQSILTDRVNDAGVLQSQPGVPFTHCFNSTATLSPGDAGNMLDQSFYLWAVVAACSVVRRSNSPELQSFLNHDWPRSPSHWLWVPS